jgi:ribosomal protein L37E
MVTLEDMARSKSKATLRNRGKVFSESASMNLYWNNAANTPLSDQARPVRQSEVASDRTRCRRYGERLFSVSTSTDMPSTSSSSFPRATRSRRLRPSGRSTRRSRSLETVASPRPNEPNTRTFRAPWSPVILLISRLAPKESGARGHRVRRSRAGMVRRALSRS